MYKRKSLSLLISIILISVTILSDAYAEKYMTVEGPVNQSYSCVNGYMGDENTIYWNSPSIQWYLNENGAGDGLTPTETQTAIAAACTEWANVSTSNVTFSYQGTTSSTWAIDNKNVFYWAESGDDAFDVINGFENIRAATVITVNASNQFTDVDIVFNGDNEEDWRINGNSLDIQAIATHEIGHMMGLAHNNITSPYVTMNDTYRTSYPTEWRTIEFDDEKGVSFLYGGNIIGNQYITNDIWRYFYWDINILSGATLDCSNTIYIYMAASKGINVSGTLILSSEIVTKMTGSDWGNIEINNGGELNITGNSTVEYSNNYAIDVHTGGTLDIDGALTINESYQGIDVEYGAVIEKEYADKLTIDTLDGLGLRLNTSTATIRNVEFIGCGQGVRVIGATSNPSLQYLTIQDPNSWGVLVDDNSDATLSYSIIDESVSGTYPYNVWLDSGADIQLYMGENDFYPGSEYAIYMHASADDVYGGGNYWGSASPVWTNIFNYYPSKVTVGYYYSTARNYGAYKPTLFTEQDDASLVLKQLQEAFRYENAENWSAAGSTYRNVLSTTDNPTFRRQSLKALLRVADQSTKDYSELRQLVQHELTSCPKRHEPLYDNLLCELFAREGRYREAIAAYETLFPKYDNTETGVDILTHLAVLYGNILNDKVKAKEYADLAADINPGQMSLEFAYEAAGMTYEPSKHVDVFSTSQELSDGEPLQTEEETETIAEFIGNNPNPFNPATTFTFAIGDAGHVTLDVYSITGQKVASLVDNTLSAGTHSAVFDGSGLGSGMYFYRFQSPGLTKNGKMLLVK